MSNENQSKMGGLFSRFLSGSKAADNDGGSSPEERENAPEATEAADVAAAQAVVPPSRPAVSTPAEVWRRIPVAINWEGKNRLEIQVDKTSTKARIVISPPAKDELETFDSGVLDQALAKCGIVYGLDYVAINGVFDPASGAPRYNTPIIVAVGEPATDGVDGTVNELFERGNKLHFDERPDGTIDFKNLHIVNNISKGTVICEITNPVQGAPGTSVYGKPIRPVPAKMPAIPRGENVDRVDLDETRANLVAAIDGNLNFKNGRFSIESTFRVTGNVDNSVGNIDFTGNVIVSGDVFEGYTIKTGHDVTVYGIVEGASIFAGGDIHLEKGINGMNKGILEAKGDIVAKFIENCTVRAGGNIQAESIINCTVESDGDISLSGRGTLVGGTVTAFGSIKAKIVGTRSNTPTQIVLGITPNMLRERNAVRQQYKDVMNEYQSLTRDIIYLEQPKYAEDVNRQKLLEQYRGKLNLVSFKKARLEKRIKELTEEQEATMASTLTCNTAFPPLRVTIGAEILRVDDIQNMCRFYQESSGEVVLGKL